MEKLNKALNMEDIIEKFNYELFKEIKEKISSAENIIQKDNRIRFYVSRKEFKQIRTYYCFQNSSYMLLNSNKKNGFVEFFKLY